MHTHIHSTYSYTHILEDIDVDTRRSARARASRLDFTTHSSVLRPPSALPHRKSSAQAPNRALVNVRIRITKRTDRLSALAICECECESVPRCSWFADGGRESGQPEVLSARHGRRKTIGTEDIDMAGDWSVFPSRIFVETRFPSPQPRTLLQGFTVNNSPCHLKTPAPGKQYLDNLNP